jgi:hypothetical protein
LSAWKLYDHYDSLNGCEQTRRQMIEIAHKYIDEKERRADLGQSVSQAAALLGARCVSDNDPRLTSK